LSQLAQRYYRPLTTFFRKRAHDAEAQDLVQQVFLRLAQYPDVDKIRDAEGYIFQTASNTLRDYIRHKAVRQRVIDEKLATGGELGSDFSPERVLLGRENITLLAGALRQLPTRTRDVLMLRCFEGLRHSEIARLQGISVRAVEKHIERGLEVLSKAIEYKDCE
jgi:RNA polymerase sigma-70 factor (ECF subfamily)